MNSDIKKIILSDKVDPKQFAGSKLIRFEVLGSRIECSSWSSLHDDLEKHLREQRHLEPEQMPLKYVRDGAQYSYKGALKLIRAARIPLSECAVQFEDSQGRFKDALEQSRNYWVFQGNPEIFDVVGALQDCSESNIEWGVAQHKSEIAPGDKIILWVVGAESGCYALCKASSDVRPRTKNSGNANYYRNAEFEDREGDAIELSLEINLANSPILKAAVSKLPEFSEFNGGKQGTNLRATKEQYEIMRALAMKQIDDSNDDKIAEIKSIPLNSIYYGPPGTGKTYFLKNELFSRFTEKDAELSEEEFSEEFVSEMAWWEAITLAMLEIECGKVSDILGHPIVKAKNRLSRSKSPRATIWSVLQTHTKTDCANVAYKLRSEPLLFWKDANSEWSIDVDLAAELVPELIESREKWRKGPPETVDNDHYVFTTFHQSYAYEDFIEGIRPVLSGGNEGSEGEIRYEIRPGIFKEIAAKVRLHPDKDYAIFIDEINRGNIANIFGELITLIEEDKREGAANEMQTYLPYSREQFSVPRNLHIVGTMNTADRSVEALDTALRRRFTFVEMMPDPEIIQNHPDSDVDLQKMLSAINARIERLLDRDHTIGHAYFMNIVSSEDPLRDLKLTFKNRIIPLLQEYFYGDSGKIAMVLGEAFVHADRSEQEFAARDYDEFEVSAAYVFEDPLNLRIADFQEIYE